MRPALARVPGRSAIIDCELVACDETGMPSFRSLMNLGNKAPALCLWCFDLLSLDGVRNTPLPLVERRALLGKIVTAASTRHLQFSGEFDDPVALLDTCQRMNSRALSRSGKTPLTDRGRLATGSKSKPPPGAQRTVDVGNYLRSGASRAIVS